MNWTQVDEVWKKFALNNELEIHVSERPYLYGLKTEYRIVDNRRKSRIVIEGILHKQNKGNNLYQSNIIVEEILLKHFEFNEVVNKRFLGLFRNKYDSPIKNELLYLLRKYNAGKLILVEKNKIQLKFDYIFEKLEDFEQSLELVKATLKKLQ